MLQQYKFKILPSFWFDVHITNIVTRRKRWTQYIRLKSDSPLLQIYTIHFAVVNKWQAYHDITAFHRLNTFVLQLQTNNSFVYLDSHAVFAILSMLVEKWYYVWSRSDTDLSMFVLLDFTSTRRDYWDLTRSVRERGEGRGERSGT